MPVFAKDEGSSGTVAQPPPQQPAPADPFRALPIIDTRYQRMFCRRSPNDSRLTWTYILQPMGNCPRTTRIWLRVPPLLIHFLARHITVTPAGALRRYMQTRRAVPTSRLRQIEWEVSYAKAHRLASRLRGDSALSTTFVPTPALR
jgi:hypothetical protein